MAYRIAICDDEQAEVEKLSAIVNDWSTRFGSPSEIHSFASAEAFLFAYEDDKAYDILLGSGAGRESPLAGTGIHDCHRHAACAAS